MVLDWFITFGSTCHHHHRYHRQHYHYCHHYDHHYHHHHHFHHHHCHEVILITIGTGRPVPWAALTPWERRRHLLFTRLCRSLPRPAAAWPHYETSIEGLGTSFVCLFGSSSSPAQLSDTLAFSITTEPVHHHCCGLIGIGHETKV